MLHYADLSRASNLRLQGFSGLDLGFRFAVLRGLCFREYDDDSDDEDGNGGKR